MYNEVNQIRFKTSVLRPSLCYYSDAYILVKGTVAVLQEIAEAPYNANKKVISKNCAPFTNCISRMNNMHINGAHDIDVLMLLYNLIEYSDKYLKTSGILW